MQHKSFEQEALVRVELERGREPRATRRAARTEARGSCPTRLAVEVAAAGRRARRGCRGRGSRVPRCPRQVPCVARGVREPGWRSSMPPAEPTDVAGLVASLLRRLVERRELVGVLLLHRGDRRRAPRRASPGGSRPPRRPSRRATRPARRTRRAAARDCRRRARALARAGRPTGGPRAGPRRRRCLRRRRAAWIDGRFGEGRRARTRWQRDRTVSGSSSAASLTSTITVRSGGSSKCLQQARSRPRAGGARPRGGSATLRGDSIGAPPHLGDDLGPGLVDGDRRCAPARTR